MQEKYSIIVYLCLLRLTVTGVLFIFSAVLSCKLASNGVVAFLPISNCCFQTTDGLILVGCLKE